MPATADPDLAMRTAKAVAEIYAQAVEDMLAAVARRLANGVDQPGWAGRKLLEVLSLRNEALEVLDRLTTLGPDAVLDAVSTGWAAGIADAITDLGVDLGFGVTNQAAVRALAQETAEALASTHLQILRSVLDQYRAIIAEAAGGPVTGARTSRQAIQRALDRFADRGITGFIDSAGRNWNLDSYAEMATRTAVGRAQVAGSLDRFQAAGRDLVIVSDAPQECQRCRPWEGRVLSITGATAGYPTVASATSAGLHHANCRHSLGLYVPGLTQRMTNTADPEGDQLRQEQRRLERGVRHWKRRELVALDADAKRTAVNHRRAWQARLKDHVERNDLKRLRYREAV